MIKCQYKNQFVKSKKAKKIHSKVRRIKIVVNTGQMLGI